MICRRLVSACLTLALAGCNGDDTATSQSGSESDGSTSTGGTESTTGSESDTATTTGAPGSAQPRYFLRIDDEPVPPVVLEMDKEKTLEVFGEAAARDLVLIEVDSTAMLANALSAIQASCGTTWKNNSPNPKHNCALTELGQSYGPEWKTSPEFSLVRMLTMTPANAVVTGTSLAPLAAFINDNKDLLAVTFPALLAESLGIFVTQPFISIDNLVAGVQQTLLVSHPAVDDPEGKLLQITLWDAVNDMAPLAERLGPSGEHPGILVPDDDTFKTKSDALGPDFKMRVIADSNLRWVDGIDLSVGGGDMFVSDQPSILSFDFLDPEKLVIQGLTDKPTIDMRFRMVELDGLVGACVDDPACRTNYPSDWVDSMGQMPGAPVGDGTIWTQKPWLMEQVVARSALLAFADHYYERCLLANGNKTSCYTGIWIGTPDGDKNLPPPAPPPEIPMGWSRFKALDEPVPPPQFLWELLLEVAQVAIHDPTGDGVPDIAEGDASPVFSLKGIWIGLTAADMIAQIRPKMQEQSDKVANVILGKYWKNNKRLDFYYRRASGDGAGAPYLYFVGEDDLRPAADDPDALAPYNYAKPGFFSCPELSDACKVSAKSIPGLDDGAREKYRLPEGESTLYMQDDEGATYEVGFYVPAGGDPVEIVATVTKL